MKPAFCVIAAKAKPSIPRSFRAVARWIVSSAPRNNGRKKSQSGNAVIFILIGIALFGALAATFMRGAKTGQGNLTDQQARLAAQELLSFFNSVEKTVNKLRAQGCSERDINFISSNDTGDFIIYNTSTTAPSDKSCDVFNLAGGKLNYNLSPGKYQIPAEQMGGNAFFKGQIKLRGLSESIEGIETASPEMIIVFDYVQQNVCKAYNSLVGSNIDLSINETDTIYFGDENPTIAGKMTGCFSRSSTQKKMYYVWLGK